MDIIQTENLTKTYGKGEAAVNALDRVNVNIHWRVTWNRRFDISTDCSAERSAAHELISTPRLAQHLAA